MMEKKSKTKRGKYTLKRYYFFYITMQKQVLLNIERKEEDMAIFPVYQGIKVSTERFRVTFTTNGKQQTQVENFSKYIITI